MSCPPCFAKLSRCPCFSRENKAKRARNYRADIAFQLATSLFRPRRAIYPVLPLPLPPLPLFPPASCRDHRRRVISPDLVFPSRKDRTCSPSLSLFPLDLAIAAGQACRSASRSNEANGGRRRKRRTGLSLGSQRGRPRVFAQREFNGDVCARLLARPEIPFHCGFRDTGVKPGKLRVAVRRSRGERRGGRALGRKRDREAQRKEGGSQNGCAGFCPKDCVYNMNCA